jgi:hypothetical protein
MYLFKSHIAGDIFSPEAHVPAYALPEEAKSDIDEPSPFLDALLNSAHDLTHIPPVSRLAVRSVSISSEEGSAHGRSAFFEANTYGIIGALRQGQTIVLSLDLRFSWTDENLPVNSYSTSVLRGDADIEYLNDDKSVMNIRIPWRPTNNNRDQRTDIMFLVNDGTYYSAPAYVSIRHIHKLDPITQGIKVP